MRDGFRLRFRRTAWRSVLNAALVAWGTHASAAEGDALTRALVDDAETVIQFRTYAMDRHKPGPVLNEAWAAGGLLGYTSGWLGDVLRFGLIGYTSQPLWNPADASGSLLLTADQQGYSVLGQAYVSLKLFDQTLSGGRFEVIQPEVNPQDNRMTPNTFEGGKLGGKLGPVSYLAAYLTAQKTRNATNFIDMAAVAGAPSDVSSPLWLIGFSGEPSKHLALRFSSYHVPDVLTSAFADAAWSAPLSDTVQLRLGAQYMAQESTGSNALTGADFSTYSGGVRAELSRAGATAIVAYTQTGRGAAWRAPYGSWEGYTSMITQDFNQAGQKTWLLGGRYDFAGSGVPGMALHGAIALGRDQITASSGAPLPDLTEYDLTLDYRFSAPDWPKWLQPLWLRARAAYLDQSAAGHTTDYRFIANYTWLFK